MPLKKIEIREKERIQISISDEGLKLIFWMSDNKNEGCGITYISKKTYDVNYKVGCNELYRELLGVNTYNELVSVLVYYHNILNGVVQSLITSRILKLAEKGSKYLETKVIKYLGRILEKIIFIRCKQIGLELRKLDLHTHYIWSSICLNTIYEDIISGKKELDVLKEIRDEWEKIRKYIET